MMNLSFWLSFLSFAIIFSSSTISLAASDNMVLDVSVQQHIHTQCGYTRFPALCVETLTAGLASNNVHVVDIMSLLINITLSESKLPVSNFEALSSHFISDEAQHARASIGYCHELMEMAVKRLDQAILAMKESPRKHKQDIQTWLSAALTYQEVCKDGANIYSISNEYMSQISKKMEYLSQLASNSLALVNRITGKKTTGNFPNWVPTNHRKLLQRNTIPANVIVAKDGSGNYKTISEAIRAAPGRGRFVIYVKSGVYSEKIHCNKDGITLIGDGKYSTVITGYDSVAGGSTLQSSATFAITGDGFIAKDIGFQNTAGPGGEQAVALLVASDHAVFYRCSIAGYQDTLYALSLRQFYRECDIYGTVDFIFGNAVAIFQNCQLVLRRPRSHGAYNVILANGRSDPGQNTGFSIQNCRITEGSDFSPVRHSFNSYLGRAWKLYSRSIIMQSTIGEAISSRGWIEWPGTSSSSLRTLYFGEYGNIGAGAGTGMRVKWPGFHLLAREEANKFTVANFIGGNYWLPSTGVSFISGLQ